MTKKTSLRHFVDRYGRDENGNVAMIVGLSIVPILAMAGFAIDLQATNTKKNSVQAAVDSAVIAGSRSMQSGASREDVSRDVRNYINALISGDASGLSCGTASVTFVDNSEDINVSIDCNQKTTLTQLIGKQKMDFRVTSGSTYGVGKIDVAFVFDVSGSMEDNGRMDSLKVAADDAVDTLLNANSGSQGDVRIAMVPYSTGVNAGQFFEDVTGITGPYPTATNVQKLDCTGRADDDICVAGYLVGDSTPLNSQRGDTCTFDRAGNAAFTNVVASSTNPLAVSPTFDLYLDLKRNVLENGGLNVSKFNSDYKYYSSASEWESTTDTLKFWRDGAGSWGNKVRTAEGRHALELNTESGIVYQEFDTVEGEYYNVVFRVRRRPGQGASTSQFRAHWSEEDSPLTISSLEGSGQYVEITPGPHWEMHHFVVQATDDEMRVSFEGMDSDQIGALLDDVWVVGKTFDHCPLQEPLPLTSNRGDIDDFIDEMLPRGGTAGHHGIAWGWYMISNEWSSIWPSGSKPHGDNVANASKAMIIMTDGEFNLTRQPGQGTSAEQAKQYCDNAKADGVVIFTVAFSAPEEGEEILSECASGEARAFQADNEAELRAAYKKIATSIADLRIIY